MPEKLKLKKRAYDPQDPLGSPFFPLPRPVSRGLLNAHEAELTDGKNRRVWFSAALNKLEAICKREGVDWNEGRPNWNDLAIRLALRDPAFRIRTKGGRKRTRDTDLASVGRAELLVLFEDLERKARTREESPRQEKILKALVGHKSRLLPTYYRNEKGQSRLTWWTLKKELQQARKERNNTKATIADLLENNP